jgi:KDO2-lipid IV(A) lauroyltransferase
MFFIFLTSRVKRLNRAQVPVLNLTGTCILNLHLPCFQFNLFSMAKRRKKRRQKQFQHRLEIAALRLFQFWIWLPPLAVIHRAADWLGWLAFRVLRVRRKVILQNLCQAFPEKSERVRKRIGLLHTQHFAKTALEFMRFPKTRREEIAALCEVTGHEHVRGALAQKKGVLLVSGHFGNWELICPLMGHLGDPTSALAGTQHNARVNDIMNDTRENMGVEIIRRGIGVRNIIKALRENRCVVVLSDQNAPRQGIFVDFFDKPASTAPGIAAFHLKLGSPIIFFFFIRLPKGRHRLLFQPLDPGPLKGTRDEQIKTITQAYLSTLEQMIRQYPEQYFWMHRRWKTRPAEEQESRPKNKDQRPKKKETRKNV